MRSPRIATKSSPRSPQLEKARAQQRRPNAAKNKNKNKINKIKKKKKKDEPSYSRNVMVNFMQQLDWPQMPRLNIISGCACEGVLG